MAYPKKVLVALPAGLLLQVDFISQAEHRTRSDLIREALRRYIENFRRENVPGLNAGLMGAVQQELALPAHALQ